ncbi:hypothetical protein [Rubrivirga sp.]|uniref:hypothetical protein n=1 Tax=Rubrivirga sp. TaxID=1885344 RepID=UPI003C77168E
MPDITSSGTAEQAKKAAQETASEAKHAATQTASEAKSAARDVASSAKTAAKDIADTATAKASDLADQAAGQARDVAQTQKKQAAGVLSDVADALHQTGDSLRDNDRDAFATYAEQAATQIDQFTTSIRDRSVGEILDEAERFARREPGLFVGGAFLLGIFGARFLKADRTEAGPNGSSFSMSDARPPHHASVPTHGGATSERTTL